jgi:hypothetical protein
MSYIRTGAPVSLDARQIAAIRSSARGHVARRELDPA